MTTPLYLAAGTVLDAPPEEQIEAAAGAGFDGCGLRLDPESVDAAAVGRIRATADREGVQVLDIEVVRLGPAGPTDADRRLVEIGAELGARWVLTVSEVADVDNRRRGLEALHDVAQRNGIRIALEFMGFTAVADLGEALRMWSLVGAPTSVLVDALHLFRTGGSAAQVAAMPPGSLAYVQLCDASSAAPPTDLADEARHHRLLPGDGVIDLGALVAAVPEGVAMTVEVQNDDQTARWSAAERARAAYAAAARFVSRP